MVSNLLSCKDVQCSTEQLFLHGEAIQVTEPNVTVVTQVSGCPLFGCGCQRLRLDADRGTGRRALEPATRVGQLGQRWQALGIRPGAV